MYNFDTIYLVLQVSCIHRWHDAGTYDVKTKTGGPDGSIRNEQEYTHSANNGLKIAIDLCGEIFIWICSLLLHALKLVSVSINCFWVLFWYNRDSEGQASKDYLCWSLSGNYFLNLPLLKFLKFIYAGLYMIFGSNLYC